MTTSPLIDAARGYLDRGWVPVPIPANQKGPRLPGWQTLRPTADDLPRHFAGAGNVGLLLGEPSGWLVDVDLDCPEARELADGFLPPTPAVTGRPGSPASHRWYYAPGAVTKKHTDRGMIVELRSTGCQTVVGPSIHPSGEPYDVLKGEPARVPAGMLAACVEALAKAVIAKRGRLMPEVRPCRVPVPEVGQNTERRAVAYLDALPPAIDGQGGHPATYAAATALVHGFGLDADAAFGLLATHYNPRCVPPWSEHDLRHKVEDAAAKPHDRPHGWLRDQELAPAPGVDLSQFRMPLDEPRASPEPPGPEPLPDELLRVPGFVSEVIDHCLDTAPYPNPTMAFCGALALQAFLAGRKVRDPGDNRTNLYLLGLAYSAAGKDWPRKLNAQIAHEAGLAHCIGNQFASGEGLQDSLAANPCQLFQTDEIDGLLQSINRAKDARHEAIMSSLLTLYSSANSVFPMRPKAGNPTPAPINQPCLVLFGTAIPNHYYAALSERMLTNGFFARTIVLESGTREPGQEPAVRTLPSRIVETAKWWAAYQPGTGNLADWNPVPAVIEHTTDARAAIVEHRLRAEAEYTAAESARDQVGTTVWGRASETARKLALLYAISESHDHPLIGREAVRWATAVADHAIRRMLHSASRHVADSPLDADCLKLLDKVRHEGGRIAHSALLKRMKISRKNFSELIQTLIERGEIVAVPDNGKLGRTGICYIAAGGVKEG